MNKIFRIFTFFIIILTFFSLGVFYSDYIKEVYVKNVLKTTNITNNYENNLFNSKDLDLNSFWNVYSKIKQDYYDSDWIEKHKLTDWAIKWLVESIWDKHSEFMTRDENKKFQEALAWDFEWIWAVVDKIDAWVQIDRIIKGSPAKQYWLLKWDIILEANWIKLDSLSLYDAVDKIKWPAWTSVKLKIFRNWEKDFLNIEVIRQKINIPSVEWEFFEDSKIAYIALNMFWEHTSAEFISELNKLKEKNPEWLIIDLRDNWGWYLISAVEILSEFVKKWEILVKVKYKNQFFNEVYTSINSWKVFDKKIVILINGNSASASEITAWTLRDYDKAILVWEKTYWKWSVQKPFDMEDWALLKLTIAKWFTPKDRNIDKEWVEPDIKVEFKKEDYIPEPWQEKDFKPYDRQLEEAKKVLKNYIKIWDLEKTVKTENERLKK